MTDDLTDDGHKFREYYDKPGVFDDLPADKPPPPPSTIPSGPPQGREWPDPQPMDEWLKPGEVLILPPELIDGVLHRGCKMILGGGSKSFKTWTLLDLGLAVATGTPWLGRETVKGKVLYIDLELLPVFFKQRAYSVAKAKGLTPPSSFIGWNMRGVSYDPRAILSDLESRYADDPPDLVIIDPIYKLAGGMDENAAGEVTNLMLDIESIATRLGGAVAFAHHFAKGDMTSRDPIDRCSGSGALMRDPDSIVSMTRHEHEFALTVDTALRNHPPLAPFVIQFDVESKVMKLRPDLKPDKLHKPGKEPKTEEDELGVEALQEKLAAILPAGGAGRKEVYTLAKAHLSWAEKKVVPLLEADAVESSPYIKRVERGRASLYQRCD